MIWYTLKAWNSMKGRYSGSHMTIYGSILPGTISIVRSSALTDKLTERAKFKIKVLDWHREHGNNVSLTARHFGIGRAITHRWIKRLKHYGPIELNEKSRKPKRKNISISFPEASAPSTTEWKVARPSRPRPPRARRPPHPSWCCPSLHVWQNTSAAAGSGVSRGRECSGRPPGRP